MKTVALILIVAALAVACTTLTGGRGCCEAMTADCLACAEGMSVEEYCAEHQRPDCPNFEQQNLCSICCFENDDPRCETVRCACDQVTNPCAAMLCMVGSQCVVENGEGRCVPQNP